MSYREYQLKLSENQKKKLTRAYKNKTGVKVRLTAKSLHLQGNVTLNLTNQQTNKLVKARRVSKGVEIKFSKTQVTKNGGFLSAFLNLGKMFLPFLAKKFYQL